MRKIELTWLDIWQNVQRSVKRKVSENLSLLERLQFKLSFIALCRQSQEVCHSPGCGGNDGVSGAHA